MDSNKILNDYLLAHALIVSKRGKIDYTKIIATLLMIKKMKQLNGNKWKYKTLLHWKF